MKEHQTLMYDEMFQSISAIAVMSLSFFGLFGAIREQYLKLFVFAGISLTVLLISLMTHLYLLPSMNGEDEAGVTGDTYQVGEDVTEREDDSRVIQSHSKTEYASETGIQSGAQTRAKITTPTTINRRTTARRNTKRTTATSAPFSLFGVTVPNIPGMIEGSIDFVKDFTSQKWDEIQQKFECCGLMGPISYLESNQTIPFSCCHSKKSNKTSEQPSEYCSRTDAGAHLYLAGCLPYLNQMGKMHSNEKEQGQNETKNEVTLATLIRILGYSLQVATIVLALWLGALILQSRREENYYSYRKN